MAEQQTTAVVQQYLNEMVGVQGDSPVEPIVHALLSRSVQRLELLCATLLHRSYPRLAAPPLNLQTEDVLSAVVARLLKALRDLRPTNVRQFFALANQHIRWELNDLARRLDEREPLSPLPGDMLPAPDSSGSGLSTNARRMLEAIESLPADEYEVFCLVRIQELSQTEVANLLGVSVKTVGRRLNRGLLLLAERLAEFQPTTPTDTQSGGENA
jgi:RNA polymerase sigma-70 factor (ECF subfamily)